MSVIPDWAVALLPAAIPQAEAFQQRPWLVAWMTANPPSGEAAYLLRVAAERCIELSVNEQQEVAEAVAGKLAETRSHKEELSFERTKLKLSVKKATEGATRDDERAVKLRKKLAVRECEIDRLLNSEAQQLQLHKLLIEMSRQRLIVKPEQLRLEVDSTMALGLVGADASMGGSGSVLHVAAEQGDAAAIEAWLHKDPDGFDVSTEYSEALSTTVPEQQEPAYSDQASRHSEAVAVHRADINGQTPNGASPLYVAAYCGHAEAVQILLNEGADSTIVDTYGMGPMHAAARNGHLQVVQALLARGVDINRSAKHGVTPLVLAVASLQRARQQRQAVETEVKATAMAIKWKRKAMLAKAGTPDSTALSDFERGCASSNPKRGSALGRWTY